LIKRTLTNFGIPVVAGVFLIFAVASALNPPKSEKKEPLVPPPESPFASRIAGVGLVEPRTKIAHVDASISGILKKIYVSENQEVKEGQPLFALDDKQAQAVSTR
jgi:HlyD family secretion protein